MNKVKEQLLITKTKKLFESGMTSSQIAAKLSVPEETVSEWILVYIVKKNRKEKK